MKTVIALIVAAFISCPSLSLAGDGPSKGEIATEATTVKSSKSNSSERSMKAEDPAQKDAATDDGVPADKARKNAAHDTSKPAVQNMK
jgi:hypothetical protein